MAGCCVYYDLPSLQDIFFACDQAMLPLKKFLSSSMIFRQLFARDEYLRYFIISTTEKEQRSTSRDKVSRLYGDGLMRVWGWIPETAREYRGDWNRRKVVNDIYEHLKRKHSFQPMHQIQVIQSF